MTTNILNYFYRMQRYTLFHNPVNQGIINCVVRNRKHQFFFSIKLEALQIFFLMQGRIHA